jgi:hypothetical protein
MKEHCGLHTWTVNLIRSGFYAQICPSQPGWSIHMRRLESSVERGQQGTATATSVRVLTQELCMCATLCQHRNAIRDAQ